MRLGQTSAVYFASRVVASGLGFVATVYFARLLGADILGQYYLALAMVSWLKIGGVMGVGSALTKRLSEGEERGAYLGAGTSVILATFSVIALLMLLFSGYIDAYIGASVTELLIALLFAALFFGVVTAVLNGHHMVHVTGILNPVKIASQSALQIGAVALFSLGLTGLLAGYALGWAVVGCVGLLIVSPAVRRPARRHFRRLFAFAKYSWIGSLRGKSFTWLDIMVLGVFVPSGLVGIYSVCWNIVSVLTIFSSSISTSAFPEISKVSNEEQKEEASSIVSDSVAFAGLLMIPGLVGGGILAERILVIYSAEFVQGSEVLWILLGGALLYGYQKQMMTALNGIDRPDISFRINLVFICLIVVSNVALISAFGWVGAAVATALSAGIGAVISYVALSRLLAFETPWREIGRQWIAAVCMGVLVYGTETGVGALGVPRNDIPVTVGLVGGGAAVYFLVLFALSSQFRTTVRANAPVQLK